MPIAKNADAQTVPALVPAPVVGTVKMAVERLRDLVASLEVSLSEREPIEAVVGPTSQHLRRAPLLRRRFD